VFAFNAETKHGFRSRNLGKRRAGETAFNFAAQLLDVVDVLGCPFDIGVDDLDLDTRPKERFDMRARRSVVGRADECVCCKFGVAAAFPFFNDDDLAPASLAVIAATAPAPPPNTTTSVSSSQRFRASLIAEPTIYELDRKFLKKPSRSNSSMTLSSR
jgi:hypothetical protein